MGVSSNSLTAISLFDGFNDDELAIICKAVSEREYAEGAMIFVQGEASPGLWFVQSGRVRLFRVAASGREFTLCIARPGHLPCLGMCPLFDGDLCPANAQALESTTVYFIERQRATEFGLRQPQMAKLYARVLSNHYRRLTHIVSGLALHCSAPRLVDLLLSYADEYGRATTRGIELDLDVSQDMLASTLGVTRQMVAQDFLKLERAGAIDARGKHIVIRDLKRLTALQ